MTTDEKKRVRELRVEGASYKTIAGELGVSENSVASYCRRNHLDTQSLQNSNPCLQCGELIPKAEKRKPRKFCCDACRIAWWNAHRDRKKRRVPFTIVCAGCGKVVPSYGNHKRKYCSHACYTAARYGRERPAVG